MKRIYTYMCLLLLSVLSFAVTGCDDDDDDDVAKDLIELVVNKPVIRIGQNEEAKVNVVVGNGNYTVRSFNTAIATATVSDELITVKSGSQNGATTIEVMDGEGVVANISVNVGVFELEVNESEVILEVAGEKQLIVSMGNFSSNDELSYEVEDETVDGVKYRMERFCVEERTFSIQHYLFPIRQSELQKTPTIEQNPGW